MCSDRNLYSKQLIEARDEITEMKRKLKILSHQIDQLKEEIASKVYITIFTLIPIAVLIGQCFSQNKCRSYAR